MTNEFTWTDETVKEYVKTYLKYLGEMSPRPYPLSIEEFKQSKAPKKDWEVTHYRVPMGGGMQVLAARECFGCDGCEIHTVKRLSDNVVFTVGDFTQHGQIRGFTECFGMQVLLKQETSEGATGVLISEIIKKPTPLFTTHDDKEVYEGDGVWVVNSAWAQPFEFNAERRWYEETNSHFTYFSTREAAEQYVTENKPQYSLSDVIKAMSTQDEDAIRILPHIRQYIINRLSKKH